MKKWILSSIMTLNIQSTSQIMEKTYAITVLTLKVVMNLTMNKSTKILRNGISLLN